MISDLGRGLAFTVVFVMCGLQALAKAAATALLAIMNGSWLFIYVAVNHSLHLMYHTSRRDIVWFPVMPKALSYPSGILIRIICKVILDVMGDPNLRLPMMLGGSYWL